MGMATTATMPSARIVRLSEREGVISQALFKPVNGRRLYVFLRTGFYSFACVDWSCSYINNSIPCLEIGCYEPLQQPRKWYIKTTKGYLFISFLNLLGKKNYDTVIVGPQV